ncbi:MAG: two-component system LytT family sensor kinase [Marivirga sp.]|jgi:two-component system LytT family sensor kinase
MLSRLSFHVIFWFLSLNLCAFIIGYQNNWENAYLLTAIYAPVPIACAYFINNVLVDKYLLQKRYLRFTAYLIYVIIFSLLLVMVLNTVIFISIAQYQYDLLPTATKDIVVLFNTLYLLVFLFVSTQSIKKYSQIQTEKEQALKSKAETELKFLKTQLNPHFLFNTLNNLYSLASIKSDKAPEAILKLSYLLDKVLDANKALKIPIEEELSTVNDFIYLESLRYGDRITIEKSIRLENYPRYTIPPLSLIVLIENCFKHGAQLIEGPVKIYFQIYEQNDMLIINTVNSINKGGHKSTAGIGLINLKKQLSFLYGNAYSLVVEQDEQEYNLTLSLPL